MRALPAFLFLLLIGAAPADDSRRFLVTGFERMRVAGDLVVEVVPGPPGAVARGAPLALDRLRIGVEGGTLTLGSGTLGWAAGRRDTAAPPVTVTVSTPRLAGVSLTGAVRVHVREMKGGRIDLGVGGRSRLAVDAIRADALFVHYGVLDDAPGGLTLAGTARSARLRGSGAGSVEAGGLVADDAVLLWEGSGFLRFGVRYTAQVIASGTGAVAIVGKPECRISGTAPVTCDGTIRR
jgi:hypothetical protein